MEMSKIKIMKGSLPMRRVLRIGSKRKAKSTKQEKALSGDLNTRIERFKHRLQSLSRSLGDPDIYDGRGCGNHSSEV